MQRTMAAIILATLFVGGADVAKSQNRATVFVGQGGLSLDWVREADAITNYQLNGDRIAVQYANGDLYVKEGGLSTVWVKEANAVTSYQLAGNRIAVQYANGDLYVKEGGLSTVWVKEADAVTSYRLEGDRIAVQYANGDVHVKQGGLSTAWVKEADAVTSYQLAGNRIAVQYANGDVHVKQGGLSTAWVKEADAVTSYRLEGDRIAVQYANGDVYVKEGGLSTAWVKEADAVTSYRLEGDRIAVQYANGDVYVKEGSLSTAWVKEVTAVTSYQLAGNRIAVQYSTGSLYVKEGGLSAPWVKEADAVSSYQLAGNRIAVQGNVIGFQGVYTQHNDNSRTGAQLNEITLTPSAVRTQGMQVKYTADVDDAIWAQPLYVRSVAFSDGSANAVYTVTANNSVYAFNADSGASKWVHHLSDSNPALRPFVHDSPSTPVIDIGQQIMLVLFSTENQLNDTSANAAALQKILNTLDVSYWLVALDLRTGHEVRRTQILAKVNRSDGSALSFDARIQESHPALLLDHGSIYVAFGANPGEEWLVEYHGWVMRYDAVSLQPKGVFCTTVNSRGPKAEGAGIWQAGGGLAADADGNVYFLTGNGVYDPQHLSYGDGFVKLTPADDSLKFANAVADLNAPPPGAANVPPTVHTVAQLMNDRDLDLGAGGLVVIPGTQMLVGGGKTGMIYVVDGSSMTIRQSFQAFTNTYHPDWNYGCPTPRQIGCGLTMNGTPSNDDWQAGPHLHGSPAFWRGHFYDWSEKDHLKQFDFDPSTNRVSENPVVGSVVATPILMPGGLLSLSANGTIAGTGIVWAVLPSNGPSTADHKSHLYAFDAETLNLLWDSPFPDTLPQMTRRGALTVADGNVFVPTANGALLAYELCKSVLCAKSQPASITTAHLLAMPMTSAMTHSDLVIKRRSPLLPPGAETVVFRVRAHFDGKVEQFDGGNRNGMVWEATDGSSVTAKLVKSVTASDIGSIAGQLFQVITRKGSGRFQHVDWIQRTDEGGGEAIYVFYGAH
jgi:outer membrane protein assembly factor BamB